MTRWFNEWARRNRPDARYDDHHLALTWQWVHVAQAHLDRSPAWRDKKPTTKDRAHYRGLEVSLDRKQRIPLDQALDEHRGEDPPVKLSNEWTMAWGYEGQRDQDVASPVIQPLPISTTSRSLRGGNPSPCRR